MYDWIDNSIGTKPEDILEYKERETNGHDFCSAEIENLVVTDKTKQLVYDAIRCRINRPAFGEKWIWHVPEIKGFDGITIFYWAKKDSK